MTPSLVAKYVVMKYGNTVQEGRERGNYLDEICEVLNKLKEPQFCVSHLSLKILERDSKARKREDERGSGISPEYYEIDQITEDYLERIKRGRIVSADQ